MTGIALQRVKVIWGDLGEMAKNDIRMGQR